MSTPEKISQHTPGPWMALKNDFGLWEIGLGKAIAGTGGGVSGFNDAGDYMRATVGGPRDEADASLIAAAPDLLDCLEPLMERDWFKDGETGQIVCGLDADMVRAAVCKAKNLPHPGRVGGDCGKSAKDERHGPRSIQNSSGGDAGFLKPYQAGKTIGNGFGFKTPSGSVDGFDTWEAAQRAAAVTEAQDREEAATGTGPIAAVLRKYFESSEAALPADRTPETDEVLRRNAESDQTPEEDYEALADHAANLEYRLAEVTEQRDTLAEAVEQLMTYRPNGLSGEDQHEIAVWREVVDALAAVKAGKEVA